MFGVSRRMLLMGELRDLFERQDAPQVAALAHIGPPARGLPTCSSCSARSSRFPHGLWREPRCGTAWLLRWLAYRRCWHPYDPPSRLPDVTHLGSSLLVVY
jgi:hypothetical protein